MNNNDNIPRIEERVGRALSHGDLRQRPGPCDLDKVCALGLVGIGERLADAIFRLKYGNDARSYEDAYLGVYTLALSMNMKLHWNLRGKRMRWMVRRVLGYWLVDNCPLCTGVGYEAIPGSPHLSDRACTLCLGTRKRPMPWVRRLPKEPEGRGVKRETKQRWRRVCERMVRWQETHRSLLCALELNERVIGDKMVAKLANEMRL
jgi:hypothetical protein